jgi:hypothetical protein
MGWPLYLFTTRRAFAILASMSASVPGEVSRATGVREVGPCVRAPRC